MSCEGSGGQCEGGGGGQCEGGARRLGEAGGGGGAGGQAWGDTN